MSVVWLCIGDGRDEVHDRSLASAKQMLPRPSSGIVLIDDSDHELGFAGAIAEGWRRISQTTKPQSDWVVHLELDFLFAQPIPVTRMIAVLEKHPYLAQMALKRQPQNDEEIEAGGIVETDPDSFEQKVRDGDVWTENRRCFTTNPCVYSANLCHQGWPQESESEGKFSYRLLSDPDVRFAFWGAKFDPPLCEHVGERVGVGY